MPPLPPNNTDPLPDDGERFPGAHDSFVTLLWVLGLCAVAAAVLSITAMRHPPTQKPVPPPVVQQDLFLPDDTKKLLQSDNADEVREGARQMLEWLRQPPLGTEPENREP